MTDHEALRCIVISMRASPRICLAVLLPTHSVGGCNTLRNRVEHEKIDADPNSPVRKQVTAAGRRMGGAVAAPLHDVNLIRTKIPPILLKAENAAEFTHQAY
jgi:hypothetical protein